MGWVRSFHSLKLRNILTFSASRFELVKHSPFSCLRFYPQFVAFIPVILITVYNSPQKHIYDSMIGPYRRTLESYHQARTREGTKKEPRQPILIQHLPNSSQTRAPVKQRETKRHDPSKIKTAPFLISPKTTTHDMS